MAGGHAHPVAGCGQAPDYMTTDETGAAKNAYRVSFHAAQVLGRARGALFVAGRIVAGARAAVTPRARRKIRRKQVNRGCARRGLAAGAAYTLSRRASPRPAVTTQQKEKTHSPL